MKLGSEKNRKRLEKNSTAPYPMFKIINDPRFIFIGKFLSKFGIDELPQLFNILKGDMSLVGPRPLPINETKKLPKSWDFRYQVKPGILSYWAISPHRNESLSMWRKLEVETLKIDSVKTDVFLVLTSINQIVFKRIFRAIFGRINNPG